MLIGETTPIMLLVFQVLLLLQTITYITHRSDSKEIRGKKIKWAVLFFAFLRRNLI